MSLTHGAGSDDLPGIIQNNVFQATRFQNSCCPNAFVDCSRSRAVVRALVDIKELRAPEAPMIYIL